MSRSSDDPDSREGVLRPSDHVDGEPVAPGGPKLGVVGYLRFFWRQLTSMRTALVLLLLLAIAAVPGSLVPQRGADPNGVTQYENDHPELFPILDALQLFDVYTSVWFSAIYLLLFASLIGCIVPRTQHHWQALRSRPPRTPARLRRLEGYRAESLDGVTVEQSVDAAAGQLQSAGYRIERYGSSVSAERGYLRETGNLLFHSALVGVLATVGLGGGFGYSGQRVIVEGQAFTNVLAAYDSINPGRFFDEERLSEYSVTLDSLEVEYEQENAQALGQPNDFTANVTVTQADGSTSDETVRVNHPLRTNGNDIFLLGNGYAPVITVRDGNGDVVYRDATPFLPQDANLTSIGVIKVPDAQPESLGMVGFLYPSREELETGASTSVHPDLINPVVTLNVFTGDLGLDEGIPRSVYSLDTDGMTQVTGGDTGVDSVNLTVGETVELPDGLGSVTLESIPRFVSFDIHHDPTQGLVLVFALLATAGLLTSLFIPRRRVWVKAAERDGGVVLEYAGLARGDDPGLAAAVGEIAEKHRRTLNR